MSAVRCNSTSGINVLRRWGTESIILQSWLNRRRQKRASKKGWKRLERRSIKDPTCVCFLRWEDRWKKAEVQPSTKWILSVAVIKGLSPGMASVFQAPVFGRRLGSPGKRKQGVYALRKTQCVQLVDSIVSLGKTFVWVTYRKGTWKWLVLEKTSMPNLSLLYLIATEVGYRTVFKIE